MTMPLAAGWVRQRAHNLPAEVASFVGRERELAAVEVTLRQSRLLRLTGVGGCGKTQLTLRLAAHVLPRVADGAWLVPLAPIRDATQAPRADAAALGVGARSDQSVIGGMSSTDTAAQAEVVSRREPFRVGQPLDIPVVLKLATATR